MPITRFLPGFRLSRLARRLLDAEPRPPREVPFGAVLEVYAPLAIYQFVGLILLVGVILAIVPERSRVPLVIGFVVLVAIDTGFWLFIMGTVHRALSNGVAASAELVKPGTFSTSPRVRVNGKEMTLRSRVARTLKSGDLVRVITDETADRLLLSLTF